MKSTTKTYRESIIALAVLSAFSFTAQATTPSSVAASEQASLVALQSAPVILKLGHSDTLLSAQMAGKFSLTADVSMTDIAAQVAGSKGLHINLSDFAPADPMLNEYIGQAMKQGKLMVFENSDLFEQLAIDELPFLAGGEIVLFQPSINDQQDRIFVYGGTEYEVTETIETASGGQGKPVKLALSMDGDNEAMDDQARPAQHSLAYKLADLNNEQLDAALTKVNFHISSLINPNQKMTSVLDFEELSVIQTNDASGGSIGYPCPAQAKTERLCWAAVVLAQPYFHSSGEAEINISNHYTVGQYRTDQYTTIAVSPNGSANPTMKVDTNSKRAFYLLSHETTITPTARDSMVLWYRNPQNQNNQGSVTATSGMSYTISGEASETPSLGGSISYSTSNAVTMPLSDWNTTTTSTGYDAKWLFSLSKYTSIGAWVDSGTFRNSKLRAVPDISKNGLQYTTEGIWVGSKTLTGSFNVSPKDVTKNQAIWFTKNNWFEWAASTSTLTHTLYPNGYSFNNNWLKHI